jgi:hypothetical protein
MDGQSFARADSNDMPLIRSASAERARKQHQYGNINAFIDDS